MLCPIKKIVSNSAFTTQIRTKFISLDSVSNKAKKLKQWHRDNRLLFGPLLETNREKKQREAAQAKGKCTSKTQQVNSNNEQIVIQKMFPSFRNSVTVLTIKVGQRNLHTSTKKCAKEARTEMKYVPDERILQIKPYKNDYSQEYPSVTLILSKTMTYESKAALEKWKKEKITDMGEEEFNRFHQAQMAVGTKFHNTLKNFFTQPSNKLVIEKEIEGVWNSVGTLLKEIHVPKAIESNVIHPVLKYRGIIDAIADYEDKPTLIEWKKSDRPRKSISLTYDNPVQLAAYFGALNNDLNYKHLKVKDALLVIAYTDGSIADTYHFSVEKLREHWAQWLSRLEVFLKLHGLDPEKRLKGGKRLFEEDLSNLQ